MKAIQLGTLASDIEQAIQNLKVVDLPLPELKAGEVLIKTHAATCNPSDLAFLVGAYGKKTVPPVVPGFEGMGTVIASGGGALGWWLKGKRVAAVLEGSGTWAEYFVAKAKECIPLSEGISDEQGATLLINSLTAVAMIEKVKTERHQALIFNAACSALGYKIRDLAKISHIPVINIVRKPDQVLQLKQAGEQWILDSSHEHFTAQLNELAKSLKATIAFDAVAGEMTGKILSAMPPKSAVVVYGGLSLQACREISPKDLIFERKKVEGFWLVTWIRQNHFFNTFRALRSVRQLIEKGQLLTPIRATSDLEGWKELLLSYLHQMSGGKVILSPVASIEKRSNPL